MRHHNTGLLTTDQQQLVTMNHHTVSSSQSDDTGPIESDRDDLAKRMETLPQELIDIIQELTLSAFEARTQIITVDDTWVPPSIFQVNAASRKAGARNYYGNNIFEVHREWKCLNLCIAWLRSLAPPHIGHLKQVRVYDLTTEVESRPLNCKSLWSALQTGKSEVQLLRIAEIMCESSLLMRRAQHHYDIGEVLSRESASHARLLYRTMSTVSPVLHSGLKYTVSDDGVVHTVWLPIERAWAPRILTAFKEEYRRLELARSTTHNAVEDSNC
ncbi:hypothetical protein LTR95_014909 [Oleoguttula sp. CCFEE 5521]